MIKHLVPKLIQTAKTSLIVIVLAASFCGCSSGRNYWQNRADDALDIFTATAGGGFGIKLQAGPLHAAIYNYAPQAGLQAGEIFSAPAQHNEFYHVCEGNWGSILLFTDREICYPSERAVRRGKVYTSFTPLLPLAILNSKTISKTASCNHCYWATRGYLNKRYKTYCKKMPEKERLREVEYWQKNYERIKENRECGGADKLQFDKPNWLFYSDINICAALIGGFRLGFNIGELADFLLGWSGIDIAADDL